LGVCGVQGSGIRVTVWGFGSSASGSRVRGFRVLVSGGLGFRVTGLGLRVASSGNFVLGFRVVLS
jgi:hypothetical protein